MYNNDYRLNNLESFDFSLRGMEAQNVDESNSAINISDVIEVIQTDPAFGSMEGPQRMKILEGGTTVGAPFVRILEQPAPKALRFRYECEGRSAGSIPGINSTPENKTFPKIQIVGYKGRAVVVVSCVTKDPPYKPHPHNLVGKEGCKKGVCTVEVNNEDMATTFANLGIQCVKKKDIEDALKQREEIRVDPYRTGFAHKSQPSSIDLNSVRLCFQAFLEGPQRGKFTIALPPVVSEPIYDKKAMADLVICKLSHCSGSVAGGNEIILLCEKVAKEDIIVRFYEEKDGKTVWEGYGDFTPTQVHKQVAIAFRTPKYKTLQIDQPVKVQIQLKRPSDNATSEPLPFQITPLDSGRPTFWSFRSSIGQKADYRTFANILQTNTRLLTKPKDHHPQIISLIDEKPPHQQEQDANNNQNLEEPDINKTVPEPAEIFDIPEEAETKIEPPPPPPPQDDIKVTEDMDQGLDELLEQVKNLENMYPDNTTNSNEFGVYSSLQMAMKNPCDMADFNQSYEDIAPPRPVASKPNLPVVKEVIEVIDTDECVPPLPPKRVKKGPAVVTSKNLPPVPQKTKTSIFQKLFSTSKRKKNANKSREGSIASAESDRSLVVGLPDERDNLTEAEHYALYTSVAPHATASEFDEMSFYYSPVEAQKVN